MGDYIKFSFQAEDEDGDEMNLTLETENYQALKVVT
jgi:hypothetical protein